MWALEKNCDLEFSFGFQLRTKRACCWLSSEYSCCLLVSGDSMFVGHYFTVSCLKCVTDLGDISLHHMIWWTSTSVGFVKRECTMSLLFFCGQRNTQKTKCWSKRFSIPFLVLTSTPRFVVSIVLWYFTRKTLRSFVGERNKAAC